MRQVWLEQEEFWNEVGDVRRPLVVDVVVVAMMLHVCMTFSSRDFWTNDEKLINVLTDHELFQNPFFQPNPKIILLRL